MLNIYRITIIIFAINLLLISYTAYVFYFKFNDKSSEFESEDRNFNYGDNSDQKIFDQNEVTLEKNHGFNVSKVISVEIWSKASIGFFLWEHILNGRLDVGPESNVYQSGSVKVNRFKFKFRSGPLLTTDSLQHLDTPNLILVLNGRDKQKVKFATDWIKAVDKLKDKLVNVGIVMLGDEQCRNDWIRPYLESYGGHFKFLFVVYDWKLIDNRAIYQWPLGVATYRNFPNPDMTKVNLEVIRPYICNLVATIYSGSSRQELLNVLEQNYKNVCIIKTRNEWQPKETSDSLQFYVEALRLSDLTLSPIGMNHECYRIFEAMAYGSVPVVEENLNHVKKSSCDTTNVYRLLKANDAPVIYVHNWTKQLPDILDIELNLSQEYKIQRRLQIIKFYSKFKTNIKNDFLTVINDKFD